MRTFRKLTTAVVIVMIVLAAAVNISVMRIERENSGLYRVEAKRAADEIRKNGSADLSHYRFLTGIYPDDGNLYETDEQYMIVEADGKLWRIEYEFHDDKVQMLALVNIVMGVCFLLVAAVLVFIRRSVLKPFSEFTDLPFQLAKGNLFVQLPEHKSRWFGRFTWAVQMLRDSLELSRRHELEAQRDKRLLLLSLSHDIKTPLSAIKLSAEALSRGLYSDPQKQHDTAVLISKRAAEIEALMAQIRDAANEDLIKFEVHNGEVFLDSVLDSIKPQIAAKLEPFGTEFIVEDHSDCLILCDPDRLAECILNLIVNAMKYGDGKRIAFSFSDEEDCRLMTVSNTGCTLPPEELQDIFDSFKRGSNVGNAEGSGLGLYICRKLMTLMDGEAFAEIENGEFKVTLVIRKA